MALTEILSRCYVHLGAGGVAAILEIAEKMRSVGKDGLLVISEFDMTLTKANVKGQPGCCSYAIIDTSEMMSENYKQEAGKLKSKYLPMESDLSMSLEDRKQTMDEWYTKAFQCHAKFNIKKQNIADMVSLANIELRDGINDMFDVLARNAVPFLVFSAGIGDTLVETIKQQSTIRDNMHFISNKLNFGEDDVVSDIPDQIITSYTKGDPKAFASVADKIQGRRNVVLLGESLGDPDMLKGLEAHDNVIKIGFLNHNVEEMLPTYRELYDIVLVGDGDMSVITALLQEILQ